MKHVQLVRLDHAIEKAIANHPEYMEALVQDNWARVAELVHRLVGRTLVAVPVSVDELQWGGYFVVDEGTRAVVGSCAFKAPPTDEGAVEIAYFTYPGFEGRGYEQRWQETHQTGAGLGGGPAGDRPHAPETNASTRVLEKIGMNLVGEVMDPEDGRVWRWQVQTGA